MSIDIYLDRWYFLNTIAKDRWRRKILLGRIIIGGIGGGLTLADRSYKEERGVFLFNININLIKIKIRCGAT